jgi:hypothetical protein
MTRYNLFSVLVFFVLTNCSPVRDEHKEETRSALADSGFAKLSDILIVKDYSDFTETSKTLSGTGSGIKKIYTLASSPGKEFMFKIGNPGSSEPGFFEAYMSILYRFLIKDHAQKGFFVRREDGGKKLLYAAIELEPSFIDAHKYHVMEGHPLLPDKKGLAGIIVTALLLGEIDLKGLDSNDSNLGIIAKDKEKIYFKIDNGQSFQGFTEKEPYYARYNLFDPPGRLKKPQANDAFLESLGFKDKFILSQEYLDAIHEEAKRIALVDDNLLDQVLDFCESQIAYLGGEYPSKLAVKAYQDDPLGVFTINPIFSSPHATYKERVLERFAQLRKSLQ